MTYLQYFGIDAQGKMVLAENRNRIIMYDLRTKNTDVLMEAHLIGQFVYSPNGKEFSCSEPMIFWKGKLKESDPETEYTYHYLINTEKQVQIHNGICLECGMSILDPDDPGIYMLNSNGQKQLN